MDESRVEYQIKSYCWISFHAYKIQLEWRINNEEIDKKVVCYLISLCVDPVYEECEQLKKEIEHLTGVVKNSNQKLHNINVKQHKDN